MLSESRSSTELANYHLLPAAQAHLLRGLGRWDEAVPYYRRALTLVSNEAERRYLQKRIDAQP